jgi:hypothetical protein
LLLLSACGAKSGLGVDRYPPPDAGPPDLGLDLGVDLGPDLGTPDAGEPCIPLPVTVDAGIRTVEVALDARTSGADVAFLMDVTGSMGSVILQLQEQIRGSLVPALRDAIPDVRFSVSSFADFPVDPYGSPLTNDTPYSTRTPMTTNIDVLEAAVRTLNADGGSDGPESQVEALYQLATGAGRSSPTTEYVPPASCPPDTFGHPCFREGALPLVFVFTDTSSHNGPGGSDPYYAPSLGTTPATYLDAIDALNARGMPVVTFWAGGDAGVSEAQRQLARDTGAIDVYGEPLVFGIGYSGTDLVARVLEAVGTIGDGLATNVDLYVTDPVPGDAIDAVALVSEIIPLRAEPATGIDGIDVANARFLGVRGATRVIYSLEIRTDLVVQRATPQEVLLDVHFRGDGGVELGVQRLRFVVPAFDGTGCEPRGV